MTPTVAVLIPVLDRPQRVAPLVESLASSVSARGGELDARPPARVPTAEPWFLCSPNDSTEIAEVMAARANGDVRLEIVPWPPTRGDYARKINHGLRIAWAAGIEWAFLAADDLRFTPGWLDRALTCWADTRACVIGTNDLGNSRVTQGLHSTHTLIHTDYLDCGTIDETGIVLHEGYWHNFVDDELVATAQHRETWAVSDAVVEHVHPSWGKAMEDATYRKGREHFEQDRRLFNDRRPLWHGRWDQPPRGAR